MDRIHRLFLEISPIARSSRNARAMGAAYETERITSRLTCCHRIVVSKFHTHAHLTRMKNCTFLQVNEKMRWLVFPFFFHDNKIYNKDMRLSR
jgi:hypothetical protein